MDIGMLWFDNDPKSDLMTKVIRAADYYEGKYGEYPNLCYVHPSMTGSKVENVDGIEVRTSRQILPNHLWLGIHNGNVAVS